MQTITIHLLADQSIWVGNLSHENMYWHKFYVHKTDELQTFFKDNPEWEALFNVAFANWILKALGRIKEVRYGELIRKIKNFSKKCWNFLRSKARKIAQAIRNFQDRNPQTSEELC